MQCFHQGAKKRATSSIILFLNWLIHQIWDDLFLKNKDHLLSQARSELVKQEHQVGSLKNYISELQQHAYARRLEFQDARREQVRPQEELSMKEKILRDTQIRSMHGMGEMNRAQELRVDELCAKITRKSRDNTKAHFSIAGNARSDEF